MTVEELSNFFWNYRNSKNKYIGSGFATAILKKDCLMNVWDGKHPVTRNTHIAEKGTKVLIWMISRFEDWGITDNLINPNGYDARIDPEEYLENIELNEKYII